MNNHLQVPFFKPWFDEDDFTAIKDYLLSPMDFEETVEEFQNHFAKLFSNHQCLAVKSGTLAIKIALLALDVKVGDEIIVTDVVCEGVLNAIEQVGAVPILIDIEPATANINSYLIEQHITEKTKVIIAVHYGGVPCDISHIQAIARKYNLKIIEDCAQALGAMIDQTYCGEFGDLAIFSFYANKMMTSGEGGAIIAKRELLNKAKSLVFNMNHSHAIIENRLRYHYQMDNLTATLALSQLKKLNFIIKKRKAIAERYDHFLKKCNHIKCISHTRNIIPSNYQYVIEGSQNILQKIIPQLYQAGVKVNYDFIPNHYRSFYQKKYTLHEKYFPVASSLMYKRLCLPMFVTTSNKEIEFVLDALQAVLFSINSQDGKNGLSTLARSE